MNVFRELFSTLNTRKKKSNGKLTSVSHKEYTNRSRSFVYRGITKCISFVGRKTLIAMQLYN